jgi:hypothetical protein
VAGKRRSPNPPRRQPKTRKPRPRTAKADRRIAGLKGVVARFSREGHYRKAGDAAARVVEALRARKKDFSAPDRVAKVQQELAEWGEIAAAIAPPARKDPTPASWMPTTRADWGPIETVFDRNPLAEAPWLTDVLRDNGFGDVFIADEAGYRAGPWPCEEGYVSADAFGGMAEYLATFGAPSRVDGFIFSATGMGSETWVYSPLKTRFQTWSDFFRAMRDFYAAGFDPVPYRCL